MTATAASVLDGPVARRYEPGLDGLRAVAVLLVFATHAGIAERPGAQAGVGLFFVLSGYLITQLLVHEWVGGGIAFRRFYVRRALRLYPALVALVIAAVVVLVAAGDAHSQLWRSVAAVLLYVPNLYQTWSDVPLVAAFGHTWSLGIEEQFYLVWPVALLVLLRLSDRGRRVVLVGLAVVAAVVRWRVDRSGYNVYYLPFTWTDALLLGALAGISRFRRAALPAVAGAIGLVLLAVAGASDRTMFGIGLTAMAVGNTCLVVAAVHSPPWRAVLSLPPLVWLGKRSYGFYLWHLPVLVAIEALWSPPSPWALAGVGGLASLLVCAASYRVVEQPFLRLKARYQAA